MTTTDNRSIGVGLGPYDPFIDEKIALRSKVESEARYKSMRKIEEELNDLYLEREDVIRGGLLALLGRKNILLLGPPGTAKSMIASGICKRIKDGKYKWLLMSKTTPPEALFGQISVKGFKEDEQRRITTNRLPEADVAFLDEIYNSGAAVLNSLLTIINERKFENNGIENNVPLQTVFAASNQIPAEDSEIHAFRDRFLLKYDVKYIREISTLIEMLKGDDKKSVTQITLDDLKAAQKEVRNISIPDEVYDLYAKARIELERNSLMPSDRTMKSSIDIVKAQTWMMGLEEAIPESFAVCSHIFWDDPKDQKRVKEIILSISSKELLAMEQAYEEASELIRPRISMESETELAESAESNRKLNNNKRTLEEGIAMMEKKGLPVLKYKSMLEAVRDRINHIEEGLAIWKTEKEFADA